MLAVSRPAVGVAAAASLLMWPSALPAADLCLVGRKMQGAGAGLLRGAVGKGCRKTGFVLVFFAHGMTWVCVFSLKSQSDLECILFENGKLPGYSKLVVLKRCNKSARSQSLAQNYLVRTVFVLKQRLLRVLKFNCHFLSCRTGILLGAAEIHTAILTP